MEKFPINLEDLVPKETDFELSTHPNKKFTLCRWSLRVRSWATAKYTPEGLKEIFEQQKIEEIADLVFFMLKDPAAFKDKAEFLDSVVTIQDQIGLIKALLRAVGIGEPEIQKINDSLGGVAGVKPKADPTDPKPKAKRKIGAKSLIP